MISREDFKKEIFFKRKVDENSDMQQVLKYLKENSNNAFTSMEISTKLNINVNSVSGSLKHLTNKNLVKRNRPYWIYNIIENEAK